MKLATWKPASVIFAAVLWASGANVNAALLAYDGFDGYAPGDLTGSNGGTGWSGAYTDIGNSTIVDAATLSYAQLATSPGSARADDGSGSTTINFRNFSSIYGDDETETWISFLGRRNGATATNLFPGVSFYNTNGSAATDGEVSFAVTTSGSPVWRIFDPGGAGTPSSLTSVAVDPDTTYLIVAQIKWNVADGALPGTGDDAVYLYVNPTLGGAAPDVASADAGRNVAIENFDKVRIAGQNAVDYSFDEIRIGGSFADVTPTVPEPTSVALCFVAAGATLWLRRRM